VYTATDAAIVGPFDEDTAWFENHPFTCDGAFSVFASAEFGDVVWHVTQSEDEANPDTLNLSSCSITPDVTAWCRPVAGSVVCEPPAVWHFVHWLFAITDVHIGLFTRPWQYSPAHVPVPDMYGTCEPFEYVPA